MKRNTEWKSFVSLEGEKAIDKFGEPYAILIETPNTFEWALSSEFMVWNAEDFVFQKPSGYLTRKIGNFGTDHRYFGVWRK